MKVKSIALYPIYDSLGGVTLEAEVNGARGACPGGTSAGKHEAKVVPAARALREFSRLKRKLSGNFSQKEFDSLLKVNIARLGATATTALSLAFYSASEGPCWDFPNLLGNVVGGGAHAPGSKMSIQEILVMPKVRTLPQAIEKNFAIWEEVGEILRKKEVACGLGFESAWAACIDDETALGVVANVARRNRALVGVDFAASQMYAKGKYCFGGKARSREKHIDYVLDLIRRYKLFYAEDPLHEDDFEGFAEIQKNSRAFVCGDDLVATRVDRLITAVRHRSCRAVIVKPNQVGTVSECMNVIGNSMRRGAMPVVSHRSRETPDTAICRLAQEAPLAKFGIAGIRTVKLNGLLRLWHAAGKPRLARAPTFK